jgi:hypothetical protein
MYFRDTGYVPNDPSNRGYLRNPNGSLPYPEPHNTPIGFWDGGEIVLQTFASPAPNFRNASWSSPLFDLRPDLRSMTGGDQQGVPIWKYAGSGKGGRLHVVIDNIGGGDTQGLDVEAVEFVSPNRPTSVVQVTDCVNVSDQFVYNNAGGGGRTATYISFEPTGEYPIRFWRVALNFLWTVNIGANPEFRIFSSFY